MKTVVLKFNYMDGKLKRKSMEKVAGFAGIESVFIDSEKKKLAFTGDVDPVEVVIKLRKLCCVEIISVRSAEEEEEEDEDEKETNEAEGRQWAYSRYPPPYYNPGLQWYN